MATKFKGLKHPENKLYQEGTNTCKLVWINEKLFYL